METEFLTIRLSKDDARILRRLRAATGLSKTAVVKRALQSLAQSADDPSAAAGLYALGAGRFGRFGSVRRQSADIKRIARSRALARRTRR